MPTAPAMPDLDLFKIVPQNRDVRLDDLTLPSGEKMVGPDGLLIPPARNFSMIVNSATRVYSYRYDEAMRDNFVAARAMKRDAFLLGLFEERVEPTVNREFTLEVEDDRDPEQQHVRDGLTRIIRNIGDFDAMKRALMEGVWYGRAGAAWAFAKQEEVDNLWGIGKWDSVHGDSVQFSFDGHPCIMMDAQTAAWYSSHGAKYGPPGIGDLVPTDRGGTALQLHRSYWRERYAIHQHLLQKADYFEGEMAGSVQGLGLRGQVYWQYVVRTDALTWMLAYMQAVGQMDLLVFNYPAGNYAAQQQQELNAQRIIGKAAIACPRSPTQNWPAVEQIPMNSAGLAALQTLVADYFDRHIERLFVGQSMSAGADKGTGLGGTGRAEFSKATKDELLVFDANRLDQTLTRDLIKPLKKYNFPWAKFPVRFKSVLPDLKAQEKVMSGKVLISVGVPIKADELREAAGYSRPEPGDDVIGAPQMGPPGAGGPPGAAPGGAPAPGGGQPPPAWMGAPSAPMMAARGQNPTRYDVGGMGYPGGSNTHIPRRNREEPIGFTRYGVDEERRGFEAAIDANPLDSNNHGPYADWLEEQGNSEEAEFRRGMAHWLLRASSAPRPLHDPESNTHFPWAVGGYLPPGVNHQDLHAWGMNAHDSRQEIRNRDQYWFPTDPAEHVYWQGRHHWETYRGMEEAFRRAWLANRQQQNPTQNARGTAPTSYRDGPHKYCSTQVDLVGEAAFRVMQASSGIAQTDLADDGRELQPHVTALYGIETEDAQAVANLIGKFGPIKLRITRPSVFYASEGRDYDVLKFEVVSSDLERLHRILKKLPHTSTHPTYKPHATSAYLRAGTGDMYAARVKPINLDLTVDGLFFSDRTGNRTWISTTGKPANPVWANNSGNPDDVPRSGAPKQYGRPGRYSGPFADEEVPPPPFPPNEQFLVPHDPNLPQNPLGPPGDQWRPGPTSPQEGRVEPGAPQDSQGRTIGRSTSPDMPPVPIEQQQLGPTQPLDLDYRTPQSFAESLAVALGVHGRDDADTEARAMSGLALAQALPRIAYERLQDRLKSVVAHPNPQSVGVAWSQLTGQNPNDPDFGLPEGFYDPATGIMAVNGEDPTGVSAHELGHALDNSQVGGGYYQLSNSEDWKRAYNIELATGALSDYAAIDKTEGFAEFVRLVYGTPDGQRIAAEQFPISYAVFAGWGLV